MGIFSRKEKILRSLSRRFTPDFPTNLNLWKQFPNRFENIFRNDSTWEFFPERKTSRSLPLQIFLQISEFSSTERHRHRIFPQISVPIVLSSPFLLLINDHANTAGIIGYALAIIGFHWTVAEEKCRLINDRAGCLIDSLWFRVWYITVLAIDGT